MLINYTFSNFRSFKNQTTLSMRASTQRTLGENLIREDGSRILPSMVMYGANASGKSNIIMSLDVMKEIILAGSLEVNVPDLNNLELYPFAYHDEEKPMLFQMEFKNQGYHLIYGFGVSCTMFKKGTRRIVSESLSVVNGKSEIKLFERDENSVSMMKDRKALKVIEFDEKLLGEFEKKINTNLHEAELFLSRAFKSIISNELAEAVIDFFRNKLVVVSDFTLKKANLTFSFGDDLPTKDFLAWNKILEGFVKNADFGPQSIAFKPTTMDQEDSADMELVSIYKNKNQSVMIPAELMESRGTLKLLDFAIPFETLFTTGGVFVLDEFDAAIHPELIKGIIALFNDQGVNGKGAQLIFTTHNPIYLSNTIFRRDQIQFVEKDQDTFESVIYSLADFGSEEVRNDHNYLINYFKGNYGALPFIDFSKLLGVDDEEE